MRPASPSGVMSQRQTTITVRVRPNARRSEVLGLEGDTLKVAIGAPPVKGKANRELVDFLSRLLDVGRGSVTIQSGHTSRTKTIAIAGLDRRQITERLGAEHRA